MKRILLVMATQEMSKILQSTLQKNYTVATCTGAEFDAVLSQQNFDALILDLFLPGTDGLILLKNFPGTLPPIILVLTRLYSDSILRELEVLGVYHMFRIPCPMDAVENCLANMLHD